MRDATPVDTIDRGRPLAVVEVESDICDSCGAEAKVQAFVYAEMIAGGLAFCGHHGTKYMVELKRQARRVIDLRHLIEP